MKVALIPTILIVASMVASSLGEEEGGISTPPVVIIVREGGGGISREGGEGVIRERIIVREGGEGVIRERIIVREGGEGVIREGGEVVIREGGELVIREGGEVVIREGGEGGSNRPPQQTSAILNGPDLNDDEADRKPAAAPVVNPNFVSTVVAGTITPNALQKLLVKNLGQDNFVTTGAYGSLSPAMATQAGQLAQSTVASSRPGVNNLNARLIVTDPFTGETTQDFKAGVPGFQTFDPIEPVNEIVFPTIPAP
jgi:hypothetical protein